MKLYAAFDEYKIIWVTTIRRTAEEALNALRDEEIAEGYIGPEGAPLQHGSCIGCWESGGVCGSGAACPDSDKIEWVMGWRAAGYDPRTHTNTKVEQCR